MPNSFKLEVVTPEKLFYQGKVEIVIVRTFTGEEGFMANHAWACKLLDVGEMWFKEVDTGKYKVAAISGGFIDVKKEIMIFTDSAEWPEDIDVDRQNETKRKAEERLKEALASKEKNENAIMDAQKSIKKAKNRLSVKAGGKRPRS